MRHQVSKITFSLFINLLFQACALHPAAWQPPTKPILENQYSLNDKLQSSTQIELNGWCGPEDIIFDAKGNLYCGVHKATDDFSDGKILKITPQNNVEVYYNAGSWVAGLHFDADSNLIALSHKEGLIRITPNKEVTILATKDEKERPFLIPNGLDIAKDGMIYFSNTSYTSPYTIPYGRKLILEIKHNGGLYKYNPKTAQITTLIDGTYFGNGVVLSKNEDFILMTETTKYRILKYWLKGSKTGETEILIDNLPGFPNGISIRKDGSFWVGFSTKRNDALDGIQAHKGMKKFVYSLPEFLQPKQELYGIILNLSEEGKVLSALYDTTGEIIPEAGAVKEYNNTLYIGGDIIEYIGKYHLDKNKVF
ncbi:SMP-30/gluconolactonase/LRE family protein [Flammeovirga pectinis]|nr:SMP-30/gluconolactonase/LRE family protein [Flammeovirga pectinis]